ncbi:hypothetical protein ACLOJK_014714 [Asimina triloba]
MLSEVARLQEELEVSRAEVKCLQASLWEGDIQSLAVAEYLCNDIHHRLEDRPRGESAEEVFVSLYTVNPLVATLYEQFL